MGFYYFETSYLLIVAFLMAIAIVVIYRWIIRDEKSFWIYPFAIGFILPLLLWIGTPWWGDAITSKPWIFYGWDLYDISEPVFWTSVVGVVYMKWSVVGVVYMKWIHPIVSIIITERKK